MRIRDFFPLIFACFDRLDHKEIFSIKFLHLNLTKVLESLTWNVPQNCGKGLSINELFFSLPLNKS